MNDWGRTWGAGRETSKVLVASSTLFAAPAVMAMVLGQVWTARALTLLCVTSVAQHAVLADHRTMCWFDRAVASSMAVGYTTAAFVTGRTCSLCCWTVAIALYVQSKILKKWRRTLRLALWCHFMAHVISTTGFALFILDA
jgi:hypothetical protein